MSKLLTFNVAIEELENENSIFLSAYQSDIESLIVFVYENDDYYSYYVPSEIKKIIKKLLKI